MRTRRTPELLPLNWKKPRCEINRVHLEPPSISRLAPLPSVVLRFHTCVSSPVSGRNAPLFIGEAVSTPPCSRVFLLAAFLTPRTRLEINTRDRGASQQPSATREDDTGGQRARNGARGGPAKMEVARRRCARRCARKGRRELWRTHGSVATVRDRLGAGD